MTDISTVKPTDLPLFTIGANRTFAPLSSLVASGRRMTTIPQGRPIKRSSADWQEESWDMYDLVGEQHFLATTLAGRLSQARLYIGELSDSQVDQPMPTENVSVMEILESVGRTSAGRSQMLERLEVNLFVAGEGWLAGVPPKLIPGEEDTGDDVLSLHWRTLSISEVETNSSDNTVKLSWDQGVTIEANPADLYLIRVWNPHPRKWWEADSSTRASLPVLRELVGLTMHISAQIDSRLAGAGLFFVPQSARRALLAAAGLDESSEEDPFAEALMEGMITPIEDRAAASALVPLTVTVPDEAIEKFRHMSFASSLDSEAKELREESIRRLALSQDAPPEVLLGTAGMNHWGAWLVREDVVTTHLEPPLALICDALTTQFLWPVLETQGMDRATRERFVFWYDVSDLVTRPNRSQDALALHERGALSDPAVRRELGFDESDAPDTGVEQETDPAINLALDLVRNAPSLLSDPGLSFIVAEIRAVLGGTTPPTNPGAGGEGGPAAIPQTDGAPAEVPEP